MLREASSERRRKRASIRGPFHVERLQSARPHVHKRALAVVVDLLFVRLLGHLDGQLVFAGYGGYVKKLDRQDLSADGGRRRFHT